MSVMVFRTVADHSPEIGRYHSNGTRSVTPAKLDRTAEVLANLLLGRGQGTDGVCLYSLDRCAGVQVFGKVNKDPACSMESNGIEAARGL